MIDFLKHIRKETEFLVLQTDGLSEKDFINDEIKSRAFIRSLEIIGEATKKLPKDFTLKYIEIDWKSLAGMRDKLIHNYFGVDYEIVWDVLLNEIPELNYQINKIIEQLTPNH